MTKTLSIQLKAAALLIVFGLNMVVGFACSVGVDIAFNTTHHAEEKAVKVHVHADGRKHHHEEAEHKHSNKAGKDDCCNDKVLKIAQADKAVPQAVKLLAPLFFTAFVATYDNVNITQASQVNPPNEYFVLGHHLPGKDIRIAIRSFQI